MCAVVLSKDLVGLGPDASSFWATTGAALVALARNIAVTAAIAAALHAARRKKITLLNLTVIAAG